MSNKIPLYIILVVILLLVIFNLFLIASAKSQDIELSEVKFNKLEMNDSFYLGEGATVILTSEVGDGTKRISILKREGDSPIVYETTFIIEE